MVYRMKQPKYRNDNSADPTPEDIQERVFQIDESEARRFAKLDPEALDIATEGIVRHFEACKNMGVRPDVSAIREVIEDATNGRAIYAEPDPFKEPVEPKEVDEFF
jgi:hypothetical protein